MYVERINNVTVKVFGWLKMDFYFYKSKRTQLLVMIYNFFSLNSGLAPFALEKCNHWRQSQTVGPLVNAKLPWQSLF